MRYWLLRGKKPEGPYGAEALVRQSEFDPDLPVCPEGKAPTETQSWRPAKSFPDVADILRGAPAPLRSAAEPEPAAPTGPRYWLMTGKRRGGPYLPQELLRRPEFEPDSLVCPEDESPDKTRNWRAARKVTALAPWLREQALRAATPFSSDAEKTRVLGETPAPASPRLVLPPEVVPEVAPTYRPGMPTLRREQQKQMSNVVGAVAGFAVVTTIGVLAMLLTGHCGSKRAKKAEAPPSAVPYVVPAPVDTPIIPTQDED